MIEAHDLVPTLTADLPDLRCRYHQAVGFRLPPGYGFDAGAEPATPPSSSVPMYSAAARSASLTRCM